MGYTLDWTEAAPSLAAAAVDEAGWYAAVAAGLVRDTDRRALDVGCGGAGMTVALARRLGPEATVIAADHSPAVLAAAREVVAAAGLTATFVELDLDGPVELEPVDLVWSSAAVHHAGDQQRTVDALARLLAPGGRLALAEGGLRRHLPWDLGVGEPGLEVRLEAAQDRWFARMRAELPGSVPMPYGWPEALRRAGLSDVTTRTTLLERPVPLSDADRDRVFASLTKRLGWLDGTGLLSADDEAAWAALLDPGDPAWLGARGDLHSVEARSVQLGVRPGVQPRVQPGVQLGERKIAQL